MGPGGSTSAVASDGASTGAVMFIEGADTGHCCCVNIYVNNNIQGVTNSVLFGSRVVMRDPGVQVSVRERRKGKDENSMSDERMKAGTVASRIGFGFLVLRVASLGLILLVVLSIWNFRSWQWN